jgi:hypothetical protein
VTTVSLLEVAGMDETTAGQSQIGLDGIQVTLTRRQPGWITAVDRALVHLPCPLDPIVHADSHLRCRGRCRHSIASRRCHELRLRRQRQFSLGASPAAQPVHVAEHDGGLPQDRSSGDADVRQADDARNQVRADATGPPPDTRGRGNSVSTCDSVCLLTADS